MWHRLQTLALSTLALVGAAVLDAHAESTPMPVSFSAVQALPVGEPEMTLRYGEAPSQFGQLWQPTAGQDAPLIVLVHGGCWLAEYSVDHIAPLAATLRAEGYAVWTPEYRRVGEPGGVWPTPAEDLLASLAALHAAEPASIDFARTVFVGHSAGGHLALWLAANTQRLPAGFRAAGAVGLAAITDLSAYAQQEGSCQSATPQLLGGMPDEVPARYAEALPAALEFSTSVTLLLGNQDPIVGADQASALPEARLQQLEGAGHFDLIHPGTSAYTAVSGAIASYAR